MSMITYSAVFSDGTQVTRKSNRVYKYVWRVTYTRPYDGNMIVARGFTADLQSARKKVLECAPYVDRKRWVGESSHDREVRIAREEIDRAKAIATRTIEIISLETGYTVSAEGV